MSSIKNILLIAGITTTGITACNYTVGECWPVGQGGGSSGETVTAGGGVIIPNGPAGVGGYGDTPPKQPQDATDPKQKIKCNSDEDEGEGDSKNPCTGGGDTAGSDTYLVCSDPCPEHDAQCMSGVITYFQPKHFKFVTIIEDDGTVGGWQETNTPLIFMHNIGELNICPVRIGMPLRAEAWGKILASTAATYSADVANTAASKLWPTDLPQGIFCSKLKDEMTNLFKERYKALGAKVN